MQLGYQLQPSEPAVFIELYLPKRAEYQGCLYETLTQGLDKQHIVQHFLDPEKRKRISDFLKLDFEFDHLGRYLDGWIQAFPEDLFSGYSMYEVDGVYRNDEGAVYEERVQILRLVFRPSSTTADVDGERWKKYVKLFVFGYVVFEVCERIGELVHIANRSRSPQAQMSRLVQDEIWVCSQWNVSLNRVLRLSPTASTQ